MPVSRRLHGFHGGVRVPRHKTLSGESPLEPVPCPHELVLPLDQHVGSPAEPVVAPGARVLKGERIARPGGYVSMALHAPTSGRIAAIEARPVADRMREAAQCVVLEPDGADRWCAREPVESPEDLTPPQIRARIASAGIIGLGGAGFPTHVKVSEGMAGEVDTLVVNGVECEPYITCDDRLIRERAAEVMAGANLLRRAVQARHCVVAVEDDMEAAYSALRAVARGDVEIVRVPERYPAGGEEQLIRTLTGMEVPVGGLPIEIGVLVHNVATAVAVWRAVRDGTPMISRIVTVTGAVARPRNLEVLVGTPVEDLLRHCGGALDPDATLVLGGPMMGVPVTDVRAPVTKATPCVLVLERTAFAFEPKPCIRCGDCIDVCPARLQPQALYELAESGELEAARRLNLFECIECGCCAYVCPSHIPLVDFFRYAKSEIWERERDKREADQARLRHEFKEFRLEREKQEKAEKFAKAAEKQKAAAGTEVAPTDPEEARKKAILQAALERARLAKEGVTPKNTDNLPPAVEKEIAEIDARRAQAETRSESGESTP